MLFVYVGLMAIVFGPLGAWVAVQKKRSMSEGVILGALFGPLGVIVEALLPQGTIQPGNVVRSGARNIDELGVIATITDRFRTTLEDANPDWERLSYPRKRALLKPVEKQIMKELKLLPTQFSDYAAEARRSLLRSAKPNA